MKLFDRFRHWVSAMEDLEDPTGAEVRRLREQVRVLEARQSGRSTDGERGLR